MRVENLPSARVRCPSARESRGHPCLSCGRQVVRRPYVFLFRDAKDPMERGVINLATAQIQFSEDQQDDVPNSFRCDSVLNPFRCDSVHNSGTLQWYRC